MAKIPPINSSILRDTTMVVDFTVNVKVSRIFMFRLWAAIQLIKLAGLVSGMEIEIKE